MWKIDQRENRPVIINATNIGKRSSGIGIYTLNILKEISRLKTRVNFIIYLNKTCFNEVQDIDFPPNITLRWVSSLISPDNYFKGHLLRLLYANYLSLKHARSLMIITSQLEACFFRSKQIITVHDIIPLQYKKYHKKQYFYFKYLLYFALKKTEKIITPSYHTRLSLQRNYDLNADKIHVIPNGTRKFNTVGEGPSIKFEEKYILYVGRICPMKNVISLLKAFNLLKDKIPHKLVICGDGEAYLEKAVQRGELTTFEYKNEKVKLVGYVSDETIGNLYKNASLFIFPSFAEGFGLPPLESMNYGCPVVVSNAESLPEVCGNAAYYIDPYDLNRMAEGIYQVLTDNKLRQQLILHGYKRAGLFSWQKSAISHLNLIMELAGNKSHAVPLRSHSIYSIPTVTKKAVID